MRNSTDLAASGESVVREFLRRTHLITVRLSGEEHENLLRSCTSDGARSISEFVRETILQRISLQRSAASGLLTGDLNTVANKLEELDSALRDLSERIGHILGPAQLPRDSARDSGIAPLELAEHATASDRNGRAPI